MIFLARGAINFSEIKKILIAIKIRLRFSVAGAINFLEIKKILIGD